MPLLRLGYRVLAIDTCPVLLQALKARTRGLPLRAMGEDLRDSTAKRASHLEPREDVRALLGGGARSLAPDGRDLPERNDSLPR